MGITSRNYAFWPTNYLCLMAVLANVGSSTYSRQPPTFKTAKRKHVIVVAQKFHEQLHIAEVQNHLDKREHLLQLYYPTALFLLQVVEDNLQLRQHVSLRQEYRANSLSLLPLRNGCELVQDVNQCWRRRFSNLVLQHEHLFWVDFDMDSLLLVVLVN